MNLKDLLTDAELGHHDACQDCPWNPRSLNKQGIKPAFGVSCTKHGVDWSVPVPAVSMLIAQDPAGTTPEKTGNLCTVCNSLFSSDRSAQHGFSLWKAGVSLADSGQDATRYMKNHYWTNATLHGVKDNQRETARIHCANILLEQIKLLNPSVIIACGKTPSESLFDLRLISRRWDGFKSLLGQQVYCEQTTLPSGKRAKVYCTFSGSATNVNCNVANLYSEDTEKLLAQRIERLPSTAATQHFLTEYPPYRADGRGMRVWLLHWLEIGDEIRRAQ